MRFFYLSLFSIIGCLGSLQGQHQIKWNSWENVNDRIDKGNKKFLVYFYFDGCKWCRFMEETTFKSDQTAKFINANYNSYHVNARSTEKIVIGDRSFSSSIQIGKYDFHEFAVELLMGNMSFPSVVFLDENFNKIKVQEGFATVDEFEMMLSYYAGNHYKKVLFKRFANNYCRDTHFNTLVKNKP